MRFRPILASTLLLLGGCATGVGVEPTAPALAEQVDWRIDDIESIGEHPLTVLGQPRRVETPQGAALEFDGRGDALVVEAHPLSGAAAFTVEVVFRPDAGGPTEQRFLHLQESGSSDRLLIETRLTDDGRWFLDTFVKSGGRSYTLFAKRYPHPIGPWYHAALVVDGKTMRHYVDGEQEMSRPIDFSPPGPGRTSIGARVNRVHWFRGAIRRVRFTRGALPPAEFLRP